jgi:hypothetical protein
MPINRLLEYEAFGPEDIKVLAKAFEDTLSALGVLRRDDLLARSLNARGPVSVTPFDCETVLGICWPPTEAGLWEENHELD